MAPATWTRQRAITTLADVPGRDPQAARRRQKAADVIRLTNPDYQWLVPVERAREAILRAQAEYGISAKAVARAAGLSTRTIWHIQTGGGKHVQPATMRKLTLLPHIADESPFFVPVTASILRVRALAVLGWGQKHLREIVGAELNLSQSERVTVALAGRLAAALKAHANDVGPSPRTSKIAIGHGWLGPDAYDQDLLYDPLWDGHGGLLDYGQDDDVTRAEYRFLRHQGGVPMAEAAARLGQDEDWARRQEKSMSRKRERAAAKVRKAAAARRAEQEATPLAG